MENYNFYVKSDNLFLFLCLIIVLFNTCGCSQDIVESTDLSSSEIFSCCDADIMLFEDYADWNLTDAESYIEPTEDCINDDFEDAGGDSSYIDISYNDVTEIIEPLDKIKLPERGFYMGILPNPSIDRDYDITYPMASDYAEFVPVWGEPTPFYRLSEVLGGWWGDTFVQKLIRGNGMFPLIHLSFFDKYVNLVVPPDIEGASLNDPVWREAYKKAALDVVKIIRPAYISAGNEVNRWFEKYGIGGDNGFENFISLYEDIYDSIKQISPKTNVFCVFAREIAPGKEANLDVLNLFNPEKLDILVITSYPYPGRKSPDKVPDDYYKKVSDYMPQKPFGFSEIAWSSADYAGGEKSQADFLRDVINRLTANQGIKLHLLGWTWMHDLSDTDTVNIGLIKYDNTEKESYSVWKVISSKN